MKKFLILLLFLLVTGLVSSLLLTNHLHAAAEPKDVLEPFSGEFLALTAKGEFPGLPFKVGDTYQSLLNKTGKKSAKLRGQSGFVPVQIADRQWALFNDVTPDGHYHVTSASKICGFMLSEPAIGYKDLLKKLGTPFEKRVDDPNYYQLIYHAGNFTVLYERRSSVMKIWIMPLAK